MARGKTALGQAAVTLLRSWTPFLKWVPNPMPGVAHSSCHLMPDVGAWQGQLPKHLGADLIQHPQHPAPRVTPCSLPKHIRRMQPRQDARGTAREEGGAAVPARCLPLHPGQLRGNCSGRAEACSGSDLETSWACNYEPPAAGRDGFGSLGLGTLTGSAMEQWQRPRNVSGPGCARGCLQSDFGCVLMAIREHRAQEASLAVQVASSLGEAR